MLIRERFPLMAEAGEGGAGGAGGSAGDAGANTGDAGAGDAGGAGASDGGSAGAGGQAAGDASLLAKPAPADEYAWLDPKFQVKDAEGKLDLAASSKKLNESYGALSKRLGTGDVPPATPADYAFQAPEQFKDIKLDDAMSQSFRERCHKLGYTQQQYQGAVEAYLELVPGVLDSVLKLSQEEARAQLRQVWTTEAQFEDGVKDAQTAINNAPAQIREELWGRFGRDPAFIQYAAWVGSQMREDTSPGRTSSGGEGAGTAEQLMASEAYRNPKHPEHTAVSQKVRDLFQQRTAGSTAVF